MGFCPLLFFSEPHPNKALPGTPSSELPIRIQTSSFVRICCQVAAPSCKASSTPEHIYCQERLRSNQAPFETHPIILGNTKHRRTNPSKTRKVRRDREDVQLKKNEDENHERPVALALGGLEQILSRHGFTRLRLRGPKIFDLYACLNLHSHTKVPVSANDCCHAESGFVGLIASSQDTGLE